MQERTEFSCHHLYPPQFSFSKVSTLCPSEPLRNLSQQVCGILLEGHFVKKQIIGSRQTQARFL